MALGVGRDEKTGKIDYIIHLSLEMSPFLSIFVTIAIFIFVWRVRRTFFASGWCFSTL